MLALRAAARNVSSRAPRRSDKEKGDQGRREGKLMRYAKWALAGLVAVLALGIGISADAQVIVGGKKGPAPSLKSGIAEATKEKDATIEKFLKALGPAAVDQLKAGRQIELPGLGTFQVVRVAEHRDLVGGRPVTVGAYNYVEFVPSGALNAAANSPGAVP